jgi:MHS family metabolite:H+ symporter-like MFS transporter
MFGVFIIAYAVGTLHVSRGFALLGVSLGSALMIPFILVFGTTADRIGLRRVFATGSLVIAVVSVGSFAVMNAYGESHPFLIWLAIFVSLSLAYPMVYGPESSLFASQFDARVRYTGVSFAYQVSGIFASGLTPIFATILLRVDHGKPWYLSAYMIAVSLISFASVMAMRIPTALVETDDTSMALKPARIFNDV